MKLVFVVIISVCLGGCLEISQSPYADLSPLVAAIVGDNTTVAIIVTGADQQNTNKSTAAVPSTLWAATTRYQTSGYTTEKVQLTISGSIASGSLPLVDSSAVTISIWDDVVTSAHPSGGGAVNTFQGVSSMTLTATSAYFSPCDGGSGTRSGSKTFRELVDLSGPTGLVSPWLAAIAGSSAAAATTTNDEVYTVQANQTQGGSVSVVYTNFQKADFNLLCNCTKGVKVAYTTTGGGSSANISGKFTDTAITTASGACPSR